MKRDTIASIRKKKPTQIEKKLIPAAFVCYAEGWKNLSLLGFLRFSQARQIRKIANNTTISCTTSCPEAFDYPRQIIRLVNGQAMSYICKQGLTDVSWRTVLADATYSEMTEFIGAAAIQLQKGLRAIAIAQHLGYKGKLHIAYTAKNSVLQFEDGSALCLRDLRSKHVSIDSISEKAFELMAHQKLGPMARNRR